jgi:hypothetical protein
MEHLRRWGLAGQLRAAAPPKVAWSQRVTFCESLSGRRITDFEGAFGLTARRDDRFAESGQQAPQPVIEEILRNPSTAGLPRGCWPATRTSAAASSGRRWRARSPTCAPWPATCPLTRR